jgi:hypothetical protein
MTPAEFVGAGAIIDAFIVGCAWLYVARQATKQRERHHQEIRADELRSTAIARCWEQLQWVVNSVSLEPAATDTYVANMGFGPELAEQILQGLLADAEELGDRTLTNAVSAYLNQLGLVLAQQGGSFAQPRPMTKPAGDQQPASQTPDRKSQSAPNVAADGGPASGPVASKAGEALR